MEKKSNPIKKNADGTYTITLSSSIDMDGAKVATLKMREPTVGDQLTAQELGGTNGRQEVNLFANLCQVAPKDIESMKLRDYANLQAAYSAFNA